MIRNRNYYLIVTSLFQHDDLFSLICDLASILFVGRLSLDHVGVIQNAKNYSRVTITLVNLFHVFVVSAFYLLLSSSFSFVFEWSGFSTHRRIGGPCLLGIGHFVIAYCVSTIVLDLILLSPRCTIHSPPSHCPSCFFFLQSRSLFIGQSWFLPSFPW